MDAEMLRELKADARSRMTGAINSLNEDLGGFRTGRASPQLVERLPVMMYGVEMQLNQLATISVPEPQQLAIRPYDQNALSAIERAIMVSDLSLTPNNDGKIIRLNIPRLTEERRRDLSRLIGRRVEEARVAVRNVRRDVIKDLREMKDAGMISENVYYDEETGIDDITKGYIEQIDAIGKEKQAEIMEV